MTTVKALEWRKLYEGSNAWPMIWHAAGVMGNIYAIEQHSPNRQFYTLGNGYDTLEEAQAAAFADYSARIMSAIEPAGVGLETYKLAAWMVRENDRDHWEFVRLKIAAYNLLAKGYEVVPLYSRASLNGDEQ